MDEVQAHYSWLKGPSSLARIIHCATTRYRLVVMAKPEMGIDGYSFR